MTLFLRIISASYFFRKLDMRHGRVEELIMKLSLKWNLHNPSVDTIWVREPTGLNWFSIPLNFCETWQEFSTVIYEYCRNGPEIEYIRQGDWAIVRDSDNNIIDQTQFTSVLKPEMRFDIGVIMQLLSGMADTCPQCQHRTNKSTSVDGWIHCSNADCGNWFHISFHTSQPSNVPNIKSNKPVARKGRQTSPSTVIPKLARTSVRNSRPQTSKFQRLSPKFRRILATIPRSPLEEAEAKKSRGVADKKAKEDSGGEAGTKTAAKQVIGNRGHAETQQAAFMSKEDAPNVADGAMLDLIQAAAREHDVVCTLGYAWVKSEHGYVCVGGGPKLTWEQLGMSHANATGGAEKDELVAVQSVPLVADEAMQDLIQAAAKKYNEVCSQGYGWLKSEHGYVCAGGGHKVTWEQLGISNPNAAEGAGEGTTVPVQSVILVADEAMQDRIQAAAKKHNAVCPQGYGWVQSEHGYVCGGGGHKLTWEQLGMSRADATAASHVADEAMQVRIQAAAKKHNVVCPQGYGWVRSEDGYFCRGGGHKLTWEQLGM
ncbi:hypothetical protein EYR36_010647 [Pleurotus pulmonarius]|nr:hypothetical protein EYR36_010647 [Pleurotus pulmonarius]KAF4590553.1 hypothetical protein EYR38_009855 [Pleurotus pulmonarius]